MPSSSSPTPLDLPPATLDLSIIIVNWNTRDLLRDCLHSIYTQTQTISFEIIVIDNASADNSSDMVRNEFPSVILISNTANNGFAAANNQGLRIARGRYVLLLNPDTLILDSALSKVLAYADAHPHLGVLGCQVLESAPLPPAPGVEPPTIQQTCFTFPSPLNTFLVASGLNYLFPRHPFFGRSRYGAWDRTSERTVDVVSGMFMLVRRPALQAVGLMDESYFIYAEEADWCFRFWHAGVPCAFTPCAQIVHLDGGSKSTQQVSVKMFLQLQKSLLLFHRKNLGLIAWLATKTLFIFAMLLRTIIGYAAACFRLPRPSRQHTRLATAALRFHLLGAK